jgi:hypothetical protein
MLGGSPPEGDRVDDGSAIDVVEQLRQVRARRQIERRVSDLGVPVAVWVQLLHAAARQAGMDVVTTVVPADIASGAAAGSGQLLIVALADADGPAAW